MRRRLGFAIAAALVGWAAAAGGRADDRTPAASSAAATGGWVRLPLADYDRLLRASRKPQKPPLDAAVISTVSVLDAATDGSGPRLVTTLELVSLSERSQVLPLPDLGVLYEAESAAEASVAVFFSESGGIAVRLARRGRFSLRLRSIPSRAERNGEVELTWRVADSPSNRFTASLPGGHESVSLSGGSVEVEPPPSPSGTVRVTGTLRRGETVRLSYAVAAARAPEEKLLASASESRLYRLGEQSLGVASRLRIEVLRGTLRSFAVDAAPDLTVSSAWAAGNTVTSFERDSNRPGRLVLTLSRGVTGGSVEVFFLLERRSRDAQGEITLPEIGLPDFLRGETAVAVLSPRPLVVEEGKGKRDGYERIDESDLPPELKEMADSTILLALRRVGSAAPALSVHVLAFPDAAGLGGVIDHCRILTIAARDGTRIDRWQLDVQTRDSLIRLPLPEGAELWSLQVDGKPARPLTEQRQLVVALGRGEKAARERRIEVVLAIPGALPVAGRGARRIELPKLPFPVTHTDWDLLLPESAQYRWAGGNVVPIHPVISTVSNIEEGGVPGGIVGGVAGGAAAGVPATDRIELSGTGRLSGRAIDANGAPLPGVSVTILRQEGGHRQSQTTNTQGFFLFTNVPAGSYRVIGAQSGFQGSERIVEMSEGSNLETDLPMKLAADSESVTVTGEKPLIDTRSFAIGTTFSGNEPPRVKAAAPPHSRREAAKELAPNANRQALSDEERASLQRTSETGVAAIAVELPTEGKRLHFEGNLFVEEAASLELEVRPAKHGWFR